MPEPRGLPHSRPSPQDTGAPGAEGRGGVLPERARASPSASGAGLGAGAGGRHKSKLILRRWGAVSVTNGRVMGRAGGSVCFFFF